MNGLEQKNNARRDHFMLRHVAKDFQGSPMSVGGSAQDGCDMEYVTERRSDEEFAGIV
jgi:hypothetical protein